MALLKRREVTAEALVKAKEQIQELRTQLSPLKDEIQKLKLQRACLEEKLKLIHMQRTEDVQHYKVSDTGREGSSNIRNIFPLLQQTVCCLEESAREIKTELKLQKRKNKDLEEMRNSLSKQLLLYRYESITFLPVLCEPEFGICFLPGLPMRTMPKRHDCI